MIAFVRSAAALSYADRRALLNAVRQLRKQPGRLVLWAFYALAIVGFGFLKTAPRNHGGAPAFVNVVVNDLWVCGFAFGFGLVLAGGTARWLGVFSSRAEALLLTRAQARPVVVAAYLQLRAVATTLARGFARFAYLVVLGVPSSTTVYGFAAQLCFFAAAASAIASIALPRVLARGAVRALLIAAGVAISIAAAVPVVLDGLHALHLDAVAPGLAHVPLVHPGTILGAIATGDLRAIAIPLAVAACASAAFALAARDAYPELYEISLANLEWRTAVRTSRRGAWRSAAAGKTPRTRAARSTARTWLRGAAAFVWADALMFSRRVSPFVSATVAVLVLVGGAGLAIFVAHSPDDLVAGMLLGTLPGLTIAVASTTAVRLAPALRMPLFWLGGVPLAARLAAWTFGTLWRDAVLLALAVIGYVAVAGTIRTPLVMFAALMVLFTLTRAVGLAVFAMLPNQLDQRGPAVFLRTLLSFALVAPAAVAAILAAIIFAAPFAAVLAIGGATALAEAVLLILFAAWRLAGRVDQLSLA